MVKVREDELGLWYDKLESGKKTLVEFVAFLEGADEVVVSQGGKNRLQAVITAMAFMIKQQANRTETYEILFKSCEDGMHVVLEVLSYPRFKHIRTYDFKVVVG